MVERVGRALVINPGSTGEARDHSNGRRLSYAVLDTASGEVLIDNFQVGEPPTPSSSPSTANARQSNMLLTAASPVPSFRGGAIGRGNLRALRRIPAALEQS